MSFKISLDANALSLAVKNLLEAASLRIVNSPVNWLASPTKGDPANIIYVTASLPKLANLALSTLTSP